MGMNSAPGVLDSGRIKEEKLKVTLDGERQGGELGGGREGSV